MADTVNGILSSSEQIAANYEKYKDKFTNSTSELVNSETFLNLLVAEMTNQDPLEPTSNTEFITQMAQFTQLQYAQDSSKYSMANYASSLVGKTATASMMEGSELVTKTGVVEKVVKNGDNYTVYIDGKGFDLSKVTSIADSGSTSVSASDSTSDSLGSRIAAASMMIVMYATVNAKTSSGNVVDAGIVDSIQVKNGEISIIINGVSYKTDDVVEMRYASISDEDIETENVSGEQAAETPVEQTGTVETETEEEDIADLEDIADI